MQSDQPVIICKSSQSSMWPQTIIDFSIVSIAISKMHRNCTNPRAFDLCLCKREAKGNRVAEVCRTGGRHCRQSDYMVVSCSLLQSIRTARPVDWDVKNPECGVGFRSLLMQALRLFESLRCQGSMSHVLPTHLKPDVPAINIIINCFTYRLLTALANRAPGPFLD